MPTRKDLKRSQRARSATGLRTAEPKLPVPADPGFSGGGDEVVGEAWEHAGLNPDDWSWDPDDRTGKRPRPGSEAGEFRTRYGLDSGVVGDRIREEDYTPDDLHQLPSTFDEAKAKVGIWLYDPDPDAAGSREGRGGEDDAREDDVEWILELFRDPDRLVSRDKMVSRSDVERAIRILEETLGYLKDPDPDVGGQPTGGATLQAIEAIIEQLLLLFRDPDPDAINTARIGEFASGLRALANDRGAIDRISARIARRRVDARDLSVDTLIKVDPTVVNLLLVVAIAIVGLALMWGDAAYARTDPVLSRGARIPKRSSLNSLIAMRLNSLKKR